MQFILANKAVILGFLFALSELLALNPSIKANSVFQLIVNAVKQALPQPPASS